MNLLLREIKEGKAFVKHISIETMITGKLTEGLAPKLFNHVVNIGVLSSFDVMG